MENKIRDSKKKREINLQTESAEPRHIEVAITTEISGKENFNEATIFLSYMCAS